LKLAKKAIYFIAVFILCYVGGYLLNMVIANDFALEFTFSTDLLLAKRTILFAVEIFAVFFLFYLVKAQKKLGKNP